MSKFIKTSIEQTKVFLSNLDGFKKLSDKDLLEVAELMQLQSFEKNEVIFRENDRPEAFYLIESGAVNIHRGKRIIATYYEQQIFGEMGILDELPRRATVTVEQDSKIFLLPAEKLKRMIEVSDALNHFFDELINLRLAIAI